MPSRVPAELIAEGERQLRLLRKAVLEFSKGDLDEAVNIATRLRVLFHDTKSSHSLITQLAGAFPTAEPIRMVDVFGPDNLPGLWTLQLRVAMPPWSLKQHGRAQARKQYFRRLRDREGWWDRLVVHYGSRKEGSWTRRRVGLALANRFGGAHVDPKPPADVTAGFRDLTMRLREGDDVSLMYAAVHESGIAAVESLTRYLARLARAPQPSAWSWIPPVSTVLARSGPNPKAPLDRRAVAIIAKANELCESGDFASARESCAVVLDSMPEVSGPFRAKALVQRDARWRGARTILRPSLTTMR